MSKRHRPAITKSKVKTAIEVSPESKPIVKRKFRDSVKYLAKSCFDTALNRVWEIVGGVALTAVGAIALYVWTGQAEWLYPFLKYAAAFLGGIVFLIGIILLLTIVKLRKVKALEQAKDARFISNKKGLFDHEADFEKSSKELPLALQEITDDIGRIANTLEKNKIEFWARISARLKQKSATKTANKLTKHTKRMEVHSIKLASVITTMDTSASYLLEYSINRSLFGGIKDALQNLLTQTQAAYGSQLSFRDTQLKVKGLSQDLDTALNQMVFVTNSILEILKEAERVWIRHIVIFNRLENEKLEQ